MIGVALPHGRPLVLGAPVGTELQRRGFELRAPAWSAAAIRDAPELLAAIHGDYARAGADLVVADTTCARPFELGDAAEGRWRDAIALACEAGLPVVAAIAMAPRDQTLDARLATYAALAAWSDAAAVLLLEGFVDVAELDRAIAATSAWRGPRWAALAGPAVGELARAIAGGARVDVWGVHCCTFAEAASAIDTVDDAMLGGARLGAWPSPPADDTAAFVADLASLARTRELAVVGVCCGGTPSVVASLRASW